jgi:hypothetical protein
LQAAKALADQLAVARKPLDDDDLISFIISGLNSNYTAFVTFMSFSTRNSDISFDDFETELLSHELFLESQHHSVPPPNTFAMHSNKSSSKRFGNRKPKGCFSSLQRYSSPSYQSRPQVQVSTYSAKPPVPVPSHSALSSNAALEDQQWCANSGANAHITADLENLHLQTPFNGPDKVAVGNGSGLQIQNTGSSGLCAATNKFNLS